MHLSTIKISNVLSFPYVSDLRTVGGVRFDVYDIWSLNIFIGPNGSWKSNFLEIINQTVKVGLFKDFILNTDPIRDNNVAYFSDVITERKQHYKYIHKHFASLERESRIYFELALCDWDYHNIRFVYDHQDLFSSILHTYSLVEFPFAPIVDFGRLREVKYVKLWFDIEEETSSFSVTHESNGDYDDCWFTYIRYFELFQLCLLLHNHYLMWQPLKPLHSSFATLWPSRDFTDMFINKNVERFSGPDLDTIIYAQDTKRQWQPPVGYYLCKKKLLEHYKNKTFQEQVQVMERSDIDASLKSAREKSDYHTHFYEMFLYYIRTYVGLDLIPSVEDGKIILYFSDSFGNRYRINELSSWEQSFLYLIFTLFGYGLENGILVMDEPELHLHPQKQKRMMDLLKDISSQYGIQIIMATHSPLMINELTINNVHRLERRWVWTHIHSSYGRFDASESNLIQMLKYWYTAKVFFVNRIIMVEGETDEYFFDYYLRYLSEHEWWIGKVKDYEVINVNGKWWYKRRRSFLKKFGIRTYYMWDWDNIVDTGLQVNFHKLHQDMNRKYRNVRHTHYKKSYGRLVEYIKKYDSDLHDKIYKHIASLYDDGVYILQRGDLEAYLGLHMKGLDMTVAFCHDDFGHRLKDTSFDSHRSELNNIFDQIFR